LIFKSHIREPIGKHLVSHSAGPLGSSQDIHLWVWFQNVLDATHTAGNIQQEFLSNAAGRIWYSKVPSRLRRIFGQLRELPGTQLHVSDLLSSIHPVPYENLVLVERLPLGSEAYLCSPTPYWSAD